MPSPPMMQSMKVIVIQKPGPVHSFAFLGLVSCRKEIQQSNLTPNNIVYTSPELIEKGLRLEQISIITGEVFKDKISSDLVMLKIK